jgi:PleD family two-component response regulator
MNNILRILILEDCAADAALMEYELEEAEIPFLSRKVIKEEDFVRALQEFSPDLILSDYDLPQYNGSLALAEARARCSGTPFILVTGAVDEKLAQEIITQGANDFVMKGEMHKLAPAVRSALKMAPA